MEYFNYKLLHDITNPLSEFRAKNQAETNDESRGAFNVSNQN